MTLAVLSYGRRATACPVVGVLPIRPRRWQAPNKKGGNMDFNAKLIDDQGGLGFALELDRPPTGPGDLTPKSAVWFPFQLPIPAEIGRGFTVSLVADLPDAVKAVDVAPVGGALSGFDPETGRWRVIADAPTAEDNTPAPVVTGPPSDYGTPNAIQGRDLSAPGA